MSKQLITISTSEISGQRINSVNARDLHQFLKVRKDFSNWVKAQIKRGRFQENRDFVVFAQKGENLQGGRPTTEYAFTLDAGKHIAMMSGSERGFQVRDYFIECERKAMDQKPVDPMEALSDPATMRNLLLSYTEKVLALEEENRKLLPKAESYDLLTDMDGMMCITDAAKTIKYPPRKLFDWLSKNRWIYKRFGATNWTAYQSRIQQGVLYHKIHVAKKEDGTEKVYQSVVVTAKGLSVLSQKLGITQ
jgi:phage anti-repressor protein/phage antirepressor YoqD-like protein